MRRHKDNTVKKIISTVVIVAIVGLCSLSEGVFKTSDSASKGGYATESNQRELLEEAMDTVSYELPLVKSNDYIIYRKGYTVCYNTKTKQPNWVAWQLYPSRLEENVPRSQNFYEDESVPEPRATLADYKKSGYDRGHMCPAGDNRCSMVFMRESFLLTNICPQNHSLNAGDWNELESLCRYWAKSYKKIYICCGPIFYKNSSKTIGENEVAVPDAFFKVVLALGDKPKAIGFIMKNIPCDNPLSTYVNSVDEVERITGLDLFSKLDESTEKSLEQNANVGDWAKIARITDKNN